MGLESGTYVSDLNSGWPLGSDGEAQGDDHIRLIKAVLKATFPNASGAFTFPNTVFKAAGPYTVVATDDKTVFFVDATTGPITLNLTAAATLGGRFSFKIVKNDVSVNQIVVDPNASETINGVLQLYISGPFECWEIICTGAVWCAVPMVEKPRLPAGRLTLTSGAPVMLADVAASTAIYYTPYMGNVVPWYTGVSWIEVTFQELALALDSNAAHTGYHQAGKNYDLFYYNSGGVSVLCTGPAWSTDVLRGTGATTTELWGVNGILVNKNVMTVKYDNSAAVLAVQPNQGTYLGSFRCVTVGQAIQVMNPAPTANGALVTLGLFNYYNRVNLAWANVDNGGVYTMNTAVTRQARAASGGNMRMNFISGLAEEAVEVKYTVRMSTAAAAGSTVSMGVGMDQVAAIDYNQSVATAINAVIFSTTGLVVTNYPPQLGWHFISMLDQGDGSAQSFSGGGVNNWNVLRGAFRM